MAPSGEEVIINDEIVINNLHHILTWKSQSDKDMVTVIAKLPAGITSNQVQAYIHDNRQFVMKFTEFEEFAMMAFLINCDTGPNGEMFHQPSSNICMAMLDSCMEMRGHVSTDPVISYQCINIPFLVQDTFAKTDVPIGARIAKVSLQNGESIRVFIAHMQKLAQVSGLCFMLSFPDSMTTMTGDGGGSIVMTESHHCLLLCPQTNRECSAIPETTTSFAAFNAQVQHQGHTFTMPQANFILPFGSPAANTSSQQPGVSHFQQGQAVDPSILGFQGFSQEQILQAFAFLNLQRG
jgi:hypothetical protein